MVWFTVAIFLWLGLGLCALAACVVGGRAEDVMERAMASRRRESPSASKAA
jgi:hypothetical protein